MTCVHTLSLYCVGIDGGVRASCGTVRLQDIFAHPPCDAGQLCGLQDKRLAVLGQQLGSTLISGKWGQALNFLAGHVTTRPQILDKKGDTTQCQVSPWSKLWEASFQHHFSALESSSSSINLHHCVKRWSKISNYHFKTKTWLNFK